MKGTAHVVITKDGITIDNQGFEGESCLKAAEQLRKIFEHAGIEMNITDFQAKPELEENPAQRERQLA